MKKILAMFTISALLGACAGNETEDTSTMQTNDSTTVIQSPADTAITTATTTTTVYTPAEGDATYRNGKLMVWRNSDWVEADNDIKMDDGVVIHKNGEVKKDDKVVVLDDGEVVNRSGKFFDKTGNAIGDAWDATKKGVGKAGEAIGKAAKKTKEAVTGKDKDN